MQDEGYTIESENGIVAELATRATVAEQRVQTTERGVPFVINRDGEFELLHSPMFMQKPVVKGEGWQVNDCESLIAIVRRTMDDVTEQAMAVCTKDSLSITVCMDVDTMANRSWENWSHSLRLRQTPEWRSWMKMDGQIVPQSAFAEFVEDQLDTIHDPAPARMMEVVTTMLAKTNVDFGSNVNLHDGTIGFQYEEQTVAKTRGNINVPRVFTIALRPFEGAMAYKVQARLRFRAGPDGLKLGVKLVRPERVMETAFGEVCDEVVDKLQCSRINVCTDD